MKYSSHLLVKTYIIILSTTWGSCWQFLTALSDIQLFNSLKNPQHVHSEYYFGRCDPKIRTFYTHTHLDHTDVLGKVIVRGWINVIRIPTCIILRALSYDVDMVRSSSYPIQMCVPRITYCHSQKQYFYYFYELYVPDDMIGGMDWDIYFFGPPGKEWWLS